MSIRLRRRERDKDIEGYVLEICEAIAKGKDPALAIVQGIESLRPIIQSRVRNRVLHWLQNDSNIVAE